MDSFADVDPERDFRSLPRLSDEAMGPCIKCGKQLLETGVPLFIRVHAQRCGLDRAEIQRHVGLAMAMGGGQNGLVLAGVMGPGVKPVVVVNSFETVNVCYGCIDTTTIRDLELELLERLSKADEGSAG